MKNLFHLFLLCLALVGSATSASAQVNFGVKAGFNLATVMFDNIDDDATDPKMLPTFQAGVIADINLTDNLAVQPGLLLVGKGFRLDDEIEEGGQSFSSKGKATPFYLQVPVNLLYKGEMFYAGIGPYIGFGLFGNFEQEVIVNGQTLVDESDKINFGSDEDDDFAPLDYGANVEAGVILGSIRLGAGYSLGLANIIAEGARGGDEAVRNSVISVNVAYMFGGGGEE